MTSFFQNLLSGKYSPHGYCLFWQPELLWTHVLADTFIALAYFSIPIALIHFVRQRRDTQFGWIIWLFAAFILACGATHVMSIWTLWNAHYGWEGLLKAVTAIVSVGAAIALWFLIPKALAIPSPTQLRIANAELAARIEERDVALAALSREILQRKQAEAALLQSQKIEAVGQLTAGIAHDFNNILQVVAGTVELIAQAPGDSAKVQRWSSRALDAVNRGTRLTAQLLAFSRTQQLVLKPVHVPALITGMLDMLQRTLGPSIIVRTQWEGRFHPVLCDATQLELAILNLAINARDAMPDEGTLTISLNERVVTEDADLKPGRYLEVAVSDTGTGMTEETLARAVDPFFTTKEVGKGSGLGLSMVYGIARQSGGNVSIASAPGKGCTVTIALPQIESSDDEVLAAVVMPETPVSKHDGQQSRSARILVIDDEKAVLDVISENLQNDGHHVDAFTRGSDGLALLERERYDILIVDFAMPLINGAEVARRATDIQPGIPIVFASGYADTDAIQDAIGSSAPMLRKPFTASELKDLVRKMLNG